ncbi:MAG TPA: adenylyl-sulfate kinase, partial [Alphaproteobacteria bacterium]|nr:adenylyl-sulfate kinase [Alphaproteobacteria bacterium]
EESGRPLRFPVQAVYKFDERRIVAGRIESGVLRVGDRLTFSPSGKSARVASIEAWPDVFPPLQAAAGSSVGITLDDHIFVERGDIASHAEGDLPKLSPVFRASLFWLGDAPLTVGRSYRLRLATAEAQVTVEAVERVIDTDSLAHSEAGAVPRHGIAEVVLRARDLLALDEHADNPATGRFVLTEAGQIVGGGLVSLKGYPDQRRVQPKPAANLFAVDHTLTPRARARRNGHEGAVLWFTGLSGAGKSTLAMEVERRLFARGLQIYVLDGDNVRRGLNADLGFSPDARAENIRRIGEVAALFADAGMIAITAFISPYRSDRARARAAAEAQRPGTFHEIHIKADLAVCEERDPKGLYKRARNGEIPDFTGISAPYEPPEAPELVVDTGALGIDQAAELVIDYITRTIVLPEAVAI